MAISVAIQGVLQALRNSIAPLITALLRLVVFVFPLAYLFTLSSNVLNIVWITFPIAELLTSIISVLFLKKEIKTKIHILADYKAGDNLIITISRQHGTNAKKIARIVAEKLNISFYDKKLLMEAAKDDGSYLNYVNEGEDGYHIYLSLDANKEAITAQREIIEKLAFKESFVIVGRCADYILKNNKKLIRVFLYASEEYRVSKIMEMYGDSEDEALKNIKKSDDSRKNYYSLIANRNWSDRNNYDLYLDAANDANAIADIIVNKAKEYLKNA